MANQRALRAPILPQMENDGVITANELERGYVDVLVPPYTGMTVGDYMYVYFGNLLPKYTAINANDVGQALLFQFDEKLIPDGIYDVKYTVKDWAENPADSSIAQAVVSRDGNQILLSPIFTDAVNNAITLDSVITNGGTHLKIPRYDGILAGDIIDVVYSVFSATGNIIADGTYTERHTITVTEVSEGFTLLIPGSKVLLPQGVRASAFYIVTRSLTGQVDTSQNASVSLIGVMEFLSQPWFPDAVMGWLTTVNVSNGVCVRVPMYTSAVVGDTVKLYWRGYDNSNVLVDGATGDLNHTVTVVDIAESYIEFFLPQSIAISIRLGRLDAWYSVTNAFGLRYSYTGTAFIDMVHLSALPAPVFIQASNNTIELAQVEADNSLILAISYTPMVVDDRVTLAIEGIDANGSTVVGADYQNIYQVTASHVSARLLRIDVPKEVAHSVGTGGQLNARYYVHHASDSGLSFSQEATAMIAESQVVGEGIQFFMSSGAPMLDYPAVHVNPFNTGFVKAEPGTEISAACDGEALFRETASNRYSFTVGISGYASFNLSSTKNELITVRLENKNDPSDSITETTTFERYKIGFGKIIGYANTTGARADGISPCRIYLYTATMSDSLVQRYKDSIQPLQEITKITVSVSGSASIYGKGVSFAEIPLNDDNSVDIGIIDAVSETVQVTLSLPESSGSEMTLNVVFRDF